MSTVLVCQFRTCKHDGAEAVLAALQEATQNLEGISVETSGCMGLCGAGPMVYVAPDHLYYWQMSPRKVPQFVEQQLCQNQPINQWLHPRLHQSVNTHNC